MKHNIFKNIISVTAGIAIAPLFTGCIEETFPASSATSEQVAADPKALETIVKTLAGYMVNENVYGSGDYVDGGMPTYMTARDCMCEDMPVYDSSYDWFSRIAQGGHAGFGAYPFFFFYTYIDKVNDVLRVIDLESDDETLRHLAGNLYAFRAMSYLELVRMYEYFPSGNATLDGLAESRGVLDQTVPIVEAREYSLPEIVNNPRAPFMTAYRFIMDDLNKAEKYLDTYTRDRVSMMDKYVVNGFKARLWLELASRFERSQSDLNKQLAAEGSDDGYADLGIKTADDCYRKAGECADIVINGPFSPLTSDQWHNPDTGFTSPDGNSSWVWGSYITTAEERLHRWYSQISHVCAEADWGWIADDGNCYRMISTALYNKIPDADWRKKTWIDPEDAGDAQAKSKYSTNVSASKFAEIPAYTGLKFRASDLSTWSNGLTVSNAFMRVEEMYLIKAEALAHTSGVGAANAALESFVNTYRYTDGSYTCTAGTIDQFNKAMLEQKRIEFWGEGIVYYDYKRFRYGVTRTYSGTNFVTNHRINSIDGYVAPWMNLIVGETQVSMKGPDFKDNPDFSGIVTAVE